MLSVNQTDHKRIKLYYVGTQFLTFSLPHYYKVISGAEKKKIVTLDIRGRTEP